MPRRAHAPAPAGGAEPRWRVMLLLAAVAALARARAFGNPIVFTDEEFYLHVARQLWRGALPYVDVWDRKPIGLFLVYLPAAPFGPWAGVYIYQTLAFAAVVATAGLVAATARRVGWRRGAVVAGVLYILWLDLADGQGGQSPVFYNLAMLGAAALAIHARPLPLGRAVAAMALVGIALQIKYSVVIEGVWIGAWLVWERWAATRSPARALGRGALLAGVALAPTALATLVYAAMGDGPAFVFANFRSILLRHADPPAMQLDNLTVAVELLGPLVAMAAAGVGAAPADAAQRRARRFLLGWLGAALVGFASMRGWYNHYTLAVMLPGCLCAAGFLGDRRVGRWLALPAVLLVFVAGQLVLSSELRHRGTPAEFAAVVRAVGTGPGSLYIDMGHPALHIFTGRPALTRYMFPSHLQIAREAGAIGVDQAAELDRIFARRPAVVTLEGPRNGAAPARVAQVARLVARGGYGPPVLLPLGGMWVFVYHRRAAAAPPVTTPPARPAAR